MRLAFIGDGRAEHVRRWLPLFAQSQDEVLLLTTHPCLADLPGVTVFTLPKLLRAGRAMVKPGSQQPAKSPAAAWLVRSGLFTPAWDIWHQLSLIEVPLQARAARRAIEAYKPHIVQAIRIQNEGYVAAMTDWHPWAQLVWGQDLVYFAERYPVHRALTNRTLRRADGLMADCQRDIRLALAHGLRRQAPTTFIPSNGGVDLETFRFGLPAQERDRLVLYPRGIAPYLRLDTLLDAARLMFAGPQHGRVQFLVLVPEALTNAIRRMVARRGVPSGLVSVEGFVSQTAMTDLLSRAAVVVSPSTSDGTPNSMLEAMACGAFPVMGDLESIREWIVSGDNGLLFDPSSPAQLAKCLQEALDNVGLRDAAQSKNRQLVRERANQARVLGDVRDWYRGLIDRN